ncbi:M15 family metallopeptidase [Spongiibacter nanhainus]|uniref:M15 family metallopeptidase n=1 Tax=Spongiibacter nanhainus TaxID=2794344 RepID=A0A7T4R1U0_9GAMM|nr:M15 family metallopeptidase [Spongiibacter nanhainus]QQD18865.1 M15 family metallopeptidase [Spongiibacter nanhainus]
MTQYTVSIEQVLGQDDSEIVGVLGAPVHRAIVAPFQALRDDADKAGFDLRIVSGYRSFDRQLAIWNAKACGERALLDSDGKPVDFAALNNEQLAASILRWSALPGASRHHWGTDIDIYDAAAVADDYQVQLTPQEVADDGVFGPFHHWLDEHFATGAGYGFFRPYCQDRGGIAPERWHLSYAPLAARFEALLTPKVLAKALDSSGLQLKQTVLAQIDDIFQRYVAVPVDLYPSAYANRLAESDLP